MAQYDGQVFIPLERICSDYSTHLTPEKLKRKVSVSAIELPIVALEQSQKSARGVRVDDLADYLDARHRSAKAEHDRLMGRVPLAGRLK
jgi:hypothetical protein